MLRIKPHGQLQPVEGSPVASGGIEPVSIAVHGGLVYVANAGTGGSNYTGFTLNPGGHLRPISKLDRVVAGRLPARRRAVQR